MAQTSIEHPNQALRDLGERLAGNAAGLGSGLAALFERSRIVLLGSEVYSEVESAPTYRELHGSLSRALEGLQGAGVTHIGVWASSEQQGTVDEIPRPYRKQLRPFERGMRCTAETYDLVCYAKELGLQPVLMRPKNAYVEELLVDDMNGRASRMAEIATEALLGNPDSKILILCSNLDLSPDALELLPGQEAQPLAQFLGRFFAGELSTVRFCDPSREERLYELLGNALRAARRELGEGAFLVDNELTTGRDRDPLRHSGEKAVLISASPRISDLPL